MQSPPVPIQAGPRRVAAAFISKFEGPVEDQYRLVEQTLMDISIALHAGMTSLPHLQTLTVTGPFEPTGGLRHAEPSEDLHVLPEEHGPRARLRR